MSKDGHIGIVQSTNKPINKESMRDPILKRSETTTIQNKTNLQTINQGDVAKTPQMMPADQYADQGGNSSTSKL
jgi:hypothetical protein